MEHEKVVSVTSAFNIVCDALVQVRSHKTPTRMEEAFRVAISALSTAKQRRACENRSET